MKETMAFEKVKATREASVEAKKQTSESQTGRGDVEKMIALLESEAECESKVKDLKEAKEASKAAAEAAKKALEEAKLKEKEAVEASKSAVAEVKVKENEKLQAIHE